MDGNLGAAERSDKRLTRGTGIALRQMARR
jgi:hypothetical protein